ncbi:MAG: class I SAM-dependent methyltransferase [Gammaproteobacteria bacterium]
MNQIVNAEMSEYWNGKGGEKWVKFQNRLDASLLPFGHEAMNAAAINRGERVLDIGCGCGDTSYEIAQKTGPGGYVEGVDISDVILNQARSRTASAAQSNINFKNADAQCHPFDPKVFDLVYSRFGVMFFDDPTVAFGNIRRALKPGGRIVFICWQPLNANQWVSLPLDVAANHMALPPPPEPDDPGPFSFGDLKRLERILVDSGFVDSSIKPFSTGFKVGPDLDEAVSFLTVMGPASAVIDEPEVDDMTRSKIIEELRDTLAPYETTPGVELGAATWIVTASNPGN